MTLDEYIALDATALAALVRRGEASAAELLDAAIAQHDKVNSTLAITTRIFPARAHERIGEIDPDAPFSGVPFLIKDLFTDLAGTVCTNGSDFHDPAPASASSTVVEAYEQGGFVIFGRTHSPEFGGTSTSESRRYGITRNPFDLSYSAGGSSGGSAAAVAAGIVPAAQATDAGGSIGIPASCCGLFGLKPTRGRVPLGPARIEGAGGLAVQHVLARSVRDSAGILDLSAAAGIAGVSPDLPPLPYAEAERPQLPRLRIAMVSTSVHGLVPARECSRALESAAALCAALGHHVELTDWPVSAESYTTAETSLRLASITHMIATVADRIGREPDETDLEPVTWQRYRAGTAITGSEILDARERMLSTMVAMQDFLTRYDVVMTPTMADLPPRPGEVSLDRADAEAFDHNRRLTTFCGLYNWSGQPSMSVPLHRSADGLPVGVLFAARYGAEDLLFRLAFELEAAQPWAKEIPMMISGTA